MSHDMALHGITIIPFQNPSRVCCVPPFFLSTSLTKISFSLPFPAFPILLRRLSGHSNLPPLLSTSSVLRVLEVISDVSLEFAFEFVDKLHVACLYICRDSWTATFDQLSCGHAGRK